MGSHRKLQNGNIMLLVVVGVVVLLVGTVAVYFLTMKKPVPVPPQVKSNTPEATQAPSPTPVKISDSGADQLSTSDELDAIEKDLNVTATSVSTVDNDAQTVLGVATSL